MKGKKKFVVILVLGSLSALGPFSIDMYLPGFIAIAEDLGTTTSEVSLSLSSFFIGISVGQLFYGPLLDRFGRKIPLFFGLGLYVFASISCAFSSSINSLIILRFLQAFGGCAGMVASRAIVRDFFQVDEIPKIFSLLMLVIAVSPIIAPTTGGFVTLHFGWQSIFIILACIGIITLLGVIFGMPVTRPGDSSVSLMPAPIIRGFRQIFIHPQFLTYAFTGAIAAAGLYAYIAGAPYVFMELYGVSATEFSWIFAIIAGGLIIASQVNTLLLRKYTSHKILKGALICQSVAGLLLVLCFISGFVNLYTTIFLIFIFLSCQGFAFPNSSALSIAPFISNAGRASALMGAVQLGIGAITSALVSILHNESAIPMAGVMAGCAVVSLTILLLGSRVIFQPLGENIKKEAIKISTAG
ncbi:multidrug effflux MFS transporter [soil metagenome]